MCFYLCRGRLQDRNITNGYSTLTTFLEAPCLEFSEQQLMTRATHSSYECITECQDDSGMEEHSDFQCIVNDILKQNTASQKFTMDLSEYGDQSLEFKQCIFPSAGMPSEKGHNTKSFDISEEHPDALEDESVLNQHDMLLVDHDAPGEIATAESETRDSFENSLDNKSIPIDEVICEEEKIQNVKTNQKVMPIVCEEGKILNVETNQKEMPIMDLALGDSTKTSNIESGSENKVDLEDMVRTMVPKSIPEDKVVDDSHERKSEGRISAPIIKKPLIQYSDKQTERIRAKEEEIRQKQRRLRKRARLELRNQQSDMKTKAENKNSNESSDQFPTHFTSDKVAEGGHNHRVRSQNRRRKDTTRRLPAHNGLLDSYPGSVMKQVQEGTRQSDDTDLDDAISELPKIDWEC